MKMQYYMWTIVSKDPHILTSINNLGDFQAHLCHIHHIHHYVIISVNLFWNLSLPTLFSSLELFKFLKKIFLKKKVFKKGHTLCISPSKRKEKERMNKSMQRD